MPNVSKLEHLNLYTARAIVKQIYIQLCSSAALINQKILFIYYSKKIFHPTKVLSINILSIATVVTWRTTSTVNILLKFNDFHRIKKMFLKHTDKVKFSFLSAKGTLSEDTIRRFLRQLGEKTVKRYQTTEFCGSFTFFQQPWLTSDILPNRNKLKEIGQEQCCRPLFAGFVQTNNSVIRLFCLDWTLHIRLLRLAPFVVDSKLIRTWIFEIEPCGCFAHIKIFLHFCGSKSFGLFVQFCRLSWSKGGSRANK